MLTQKTLNKISNILSSGGIIGFPTDTVYGLACDAFNQIAVNKISTIKGREASKYYVLQVARIEQIKTLVAPLTDSQLNIINSYWPGEITFIFNKSSTNFLPYLKETIGIRIPNHKIAKQILNYYKNPLVVTSLNYAGEPSADSYSGIPNSLKEQLDYIVVSNKKGSQIASTIVDITNDIPQIIRQGKVIFSLIKLVL